MFASLRNKFSNYRRSSLRFDIEKNIIIEAFDRFASLRYPRRVFLPTPRINDAGSQRLCVSLIRWVGDSPYHWYAESATPRITDTRRRIFKFSTWCWFLETLPQTMDYIETKAKGCHLKKFTCTGTLRQVIIRVYRHQTNKHLPQSSFTCFRWQHFAILLWCLYS